jgi:hypothetical protein
VTLAGLLEELAARYQADPLSGPVLRFYNTHRPHQGIANACPLRAHPSPITDPGAAIELHVHRRDRPGGILHEYRKLLSLRG